MDEEQEIEVKGLKIRKNKLNNFNSIKLHYSADPDRDPENPYGQDWYNREKPKYDAIRWNTEMELSRETYGGVGVFSSDFNPAIHVMDKEYKPDFDFPLLRGWDFGGNQSVIICQWYKDCLYVIEEFPNMGYATRDVGARILEICAMRWPKANFIDITDPTGADRGRNDATGRSNHDVMRELGFEDIQKGATNKIEPRIDAVLKLLISLKDGKPQLQINSKCHMTLTAFTGAYHYEEKLKKNQKRPVPVKNEYSHIMDALQYVATRVKTVNMRRGGAVKQLLARDTRYGFKF